MVRKFFPLDKNYLLEEAQLRLQHGLLASMVEQVKTEYERRYNPLGLSDDWILKVRNFIPEELTLLDNFYQTLAGIYRYKFGDNQLEFMWDGLDHTERYQKEWSAFFADQIKKFCRNELFIRAVLDVTVFNNNAQLAENRMNNFMLQTMYQTFEVKVSKGLIKVA